MGFSSLNFLKLEFDLASLSLMINYASLDLFLSIVESLDIIYVIIDEFFKINLATNFRVDLVKYIINKSREHLFVKNVLLISEENM